MDPTRAAWLLRSPVEAVPEHALDALSQKIPVRCRVLGDRHEAGDDHERVDSPEREELRGELVVRRLAVGVVGQEAALGERRALDLKLEAVGIGRGAGADGHAQKRSDREHPVRCRPVPGNFVRGYGVPGVPSPAHPVPSMATPRPPADPPLPPEPPPTGPPLPPDPPPVGARPIGGRPALPVPTGEPSPVLDPSASVLPESHQLPPHQGKLDRVTGHIAALSGDLREYVELRIALVQRKVEGIVGQFERFQHYIDAAPLFGAAAFLGVVGLVFVFITLALGIGAAIGSYWAGFLITTVLLLATAGVLVWLGLRKVREAQAVMADAKRRQQREASVSRADIQEAQRLSAQRSAV